MDEEDEYRRRLAGFAEVLGKDARTLPFNQLKELIREIDKYGNKIARTIARRGHHKAPTRGKGRVNHYPD